VLVAGGVRAQPSPQTRKTCELRESTHAAASAARKRNGKAVKLARRETSESNPLAVVPDLLDLPARPRACTLVAFVVGEGHATVRPIRACSRAPPVG
jgi:hypothetical protein